MSDYVPETLDNLFGSYLGYDSVLENIAELLKDKNYNRENIGIIAQPYCSICLVTSLIPKLKDKRQRKKYNDKLNESNKKFETIITEHIDEYTKLVEYELVLKLGAYNNDVIHYSVMVETNTIKWGEYADGGFSDDQLSTREYLEEIVSGIETIGHDHYYPWLPLLTEEICRYDSILKPIIESYTTHYAKIDAIHIPPDYFEWFTKPYWWRQYEFEIYNRVKKEQEKNING